MSSVTLTQVARQVEVAPSTLRRWVDTGLVPLLNGTWTPAAVAQARLVARLRARGHSLAEIRRASDSGRLAAGFLEDLLPQPAGGRSLADAARVTGLQPALIERLWLTAGLPEARLQSLTDDDIELLRRIAEVLGAGFPLVAVLQIVRVYGNALAGIADAEIKLFHLYVHEPLMRDGMPGLVMAEMMSELAEAVLPLASPIMDALHQRHLHHFVEQDVVGHMEAEGDEQLDLGRLRVAIAFADLAGYTRFTEEMGEEEAVDQVERFVSAVTASLPDDARVIKTIGDEVMIVASDAVALLEWAVGFQEQRVQRPLPRIGIHWGATLYRDGDYYGSAVNVASRVGARAAGGEVLVTRPLVELAHRRLAFSHIGDVKLKGLSRPEELFLARRAS